MGGRPRSLAAGLCGFLLAIASAAFGTPQPTDSKITPSSTPEQQKPDQEPAIVITGSRIPRRNLTAVSPVTLIGGQDYKLEGAVLTEDVINQLPQVTPDQGAFISNGATGTSTVNLRDLGASRTLILVNGRRLLPGDPTDPAADINIIPSSIIQRVEVLTGGASSVYGSDAVSGVVNFILDSKIDGLRIDAQSSFYQHDGSSGPVVLKALNDFGAPFPHGNQVNGANQDINAAIGAGFFDGRGHLTVYGGYRSLSAITQDQRDYSACNLAAVPTDPVHPHEIFCGGSDVSAVGSFVTLLSGADGEFHLGPDQTFLPGASLFNFAPDNYYQRPGRRYTAGGFANLELSDAFKPYMEAMYMDDRSIAQIAPSGDFFNTFAINCDNPLPSPQQLASVCVNGNYVGQETGGNPTPFIDPVTGATFYKGFLVVGRRNVEGGPRQDDRRHEDLRIVGGFGGELRPAINYDASFTAARVKFTDAYSNDASIIRMTRALDVVTDPVTGRPVCRSVLTSEDSSCVPWNIFVLGGGTPEAAAYIIIPGTQKAAIKQQVANVNATIELEKWGLRSPWADEGPSLNGGVEYRRDSLDFRPDAAFQSGDLAGQGQAIIPFKGATTVKELFGEGRFPLLSNRLIDSLAIEGGYRRSWHSDGTSKFASSSYKLALDLTPVRGLRFRASVQRAVRAPNIQELFAPKFPGAFDHDPCAGANPDATQEQCAATGLSAAQYSHILGSPFGESAGGYNSAEGGNQALGPETARTRAIGIVLEPRFLPGFNATVDWFDIDIESAIEVIGAQAIMDTCVATGDSRFCGRIHRDTNGSLWETPEGFIDDSNANIGALKTRGVDLSASYTRDLGRFGSANIEMLGSRLMKSITDNGGLSTPFECAGLYGEPCNYPLPKWRHTVRFTWQLADGPMISLNWRHVGEVRLAALNPRFGLLDVVSPLETHISPRDLFDLTAMMRLQRQLDLRIGVRNIFDRAPPIVTSGNPACQAGACNGNTYPELYDPLGRYIFAGFTVNFGER